VARRKRASKARIQAPSMAQALALRGENRAELTARFGSEAMALAVWKIYREKMLQTGFEEPPLPPYWDDARTRAERRKDVERDG
jgi:hypothetical protein